jgi:hypothetical protein
MDIKKYFPIAMKTITCLALFSSTLLGMVGAIATVKAIFQLVKFSLGFQASVDIMIGGTFCGIILLVASIGLQQISMDFYKSSKKL